MRIYSAAKSNLIHVCVLRLAACRQLGVGRAAARAGRVGEGEAEIYGGDRLAEVDAALAALAPELGVSVECRQSNHEGDLIDWLHEARERFDGIVINPGGFTHTSVALRDAISASEKPCVECHLSNVHSREEFRHRSFTAGVCVGAVLGFGVNSYRLALRALVEHLTRSQARTSKRRRN